MDNYVQLGTVPLANSNKFSPFCRDSMLFHEQLRLEQSKGQVVDYKDLRKPQLNWNPLKCIYNSSMCVLYVVWHQLIKHDHRCCGQHSIRTSVSACHMQLRSGFGSWLCGEPLYM